MRCAAIFPTGPLMSPNFNMSILGTRSRRARSHHPKHRNQGEQLRSATLGYFSGNSRSKPKIPCFTVDVTPKRKALCLSENDPPETVMRRDSRPPCADTNPPRPDVERRAGGCPPRLDVKRQQGESKQLSFLIYPSFHHAKERDCLRRLSPSRRVCGR